MTTKTFKSAKAPADDTPAGKPKRPTAKVEPVAEATDPPSDIHASAGFRRKLANHFTREAIALAARRAGGA